MGIIKEDQKLKISFKIVGGVEKAIDCTVKEVEKDRFAVAFPNEAFSYSEYLDVGEEVLVKLFSASGMGIFNAMVLNSPLEEDFILEYPSTITQVQRRQYPRANLKTKVIIERKNNSNIVTETLDIGGGGLRFMYNGSFNLNEVVYSRLYLPNEFYSIKGVGAIIKQPHLPKNEYVLLYSRIDKADREKVIKKCFELKGGH